MEAMSEVFESVARCFTLLSVPARIRILHAVCRAERSVGQIVADTGLGQSNVSRHLGVMYQAGALLRRREGAQVFYSVADESYTELCRAVCERVSAGLDGKKGLKRGVRDLLAELR
ncbi:MAG: metalloregulator ArsR/SmtB family transcription factor [Pseudomonadota bacterium]|nr:metalloregulator ArsR/SmtB family transcription factor [Pseudomonadota bacterium]